MENNLYTNDIYIKIDSKIIENDFWQKDIFNKKKLLNQELRIFTISKIKDLNLNYKDDLTLENLFKVIDNVLLTQEEKIEFFRHYTHYIINMAGTLQQFVIDWYQEEEKNLINQPVIEFDYNNNWNSLKTHKETPPLQTTMFVLDIFNNMFYKEDNKDLGYEKNKFKF
jgi:hypothetical protein